jgi:3-oxoacyl-[acyl-carrier protein] reductase
MDLGLRGRRVAVMAASEGLGFASAQALAREGARVAIGARDPRKLEDAAHRLRKDGAEVHAIPFDALRPGKEGPEGFVREAAQRMAGLDALVTNKGGPPEARFGEADDALWQRWFEGLVLSYVRAVRAALPHLLEQGGSVVAIESTSVKQPIPQLVLSTALRPSVVALSKALALEHGPQGVRFNVVLPGSMATARIRDLDRRVAEEAGTTLEQALAKRNADTPLRRLGEPAELGQVVAFLASPASSYVTGAVLQVDGGAVRSVY